MTTELRQTGISPIGAAPWGTHFCTFYETKQDLLDILVPFYKSGLESNEFCLWIISNSELITAEEAKQALGEVVSELDQYLAEGRIEIVSHDQWFLKNGDFDFHRVAYGFKEKLDEALANGYAGLRFNGSPAWIQAEHASVLREFEREAHQLFAEENIIASCTYPLGESRADFLLDVARNHQFTIARRQGKWDILETPQMIQAKQEIQRLNAELEQRVIERTSELAAANEELRKEITERRKAEEAIDERLRFETLVTEISAAFANLSPIEVDREIDKWLKTLVEFLGVDRASFFQFGEDWTTLYRSHSYTVPGIEPLSLPPIGINEQFPWITDQLRRGNTIKWSRIPDDLPEQAANEKEYAATTGAKSVLNIPVLVGGSVICTISFTSIGVYCDWPDATVARLRLVGEIFAAAVERRRADAERKRTEEALRSGQERYRKLSENFPNGAVITYDTDLRVTFIAGRGLHEAGFSPDFFMGKLLGEIAPPEVVAIAEPHFRAAFGGQTEIYECPYPDGRVYFCAVAPLLNGDGLITEIQMITQDITKPKQSEEALRASEEQFRQLAENIREVFWLAAADLSKMLYISPAYEVVWGQSSASLYREPRSFFAAIHVEDRSRVVDIVGRNREQGFEVEYRVVRPDGSIRWIRDRGFPIKDESGRFYRVAGIAEDITERKYSEEQLKQSKTQLAEAQHLAHIGSWDLDLSSKNVTWSDELYRIFGVQSSEFDHRYEAVIGTTHPDDRDWLRSVIEDAVNTHKPFSVYYRITQPAGEVRVLHARGAVATDEHGNATRLHGTAQDVTERKQAEDELRQQKEILQQIFDHIPLMISFVEADGRIKLVNREWERALGWSLKELREQNLDVFAEFYPDPQYRQEVLKFVAEANGKWSDFKTRVRDGRVMDTNFVRILLSDRTSIGIGQDITERKQAEEKLKQSQRQMADAQRLASVGSWNWDIPTNTHTWSDELYHIYGLHPQKSSASSERFMELVHPDDYVAVSEAIERAFNNQEPINSYLRIIRPDGVERIIHSRGNTIIDVSGTPIRMHGTVQDVTERKRAEYALSEVERKYREIFENAGEGIFQSTPDGRYIVANPTLARMYGFASPEELIHSCQDISRQVYVDPARREEFKRRLEEQGVVRGFEHEVFRKDGSRFWISVNARSVKNEQGEIQYYEGTVQDITARKIAEHGLRESEERYRELFENAKDATYVHDLEGRYTSVNRAAEKLSGYTRAEILGKTFTNFVAPGEIEKIREQLCRKLADEGETSYETVVIMKDGRRVAVEVSSHIILENGIPVGVQGTARDIAERKAAEENLKATSRQLRALSARLQSAREEEGTRIAREIHDELGSALTSLKWDLEEMDKMLSLTNSQTEVTSLREKLQAPIKVADTAISTIRRIASELRPSILDDLGLSAAIEWQAQQFQMRTGIVCNCDRCEEKVGLTEEQSTAVFRIFQEALTNVLRHAQATRVDIQLTTKNDYFILTVSDNGKGIAEAELEQQSLGILGMRERAHLIGGEIDILGIEGSGTVVSVRVPICTNEKNPHN